RSEDGELARRTQRDLDSKGAGRPPPARLVRSREAQQCRPARAARFVPLTRRDCLRFYVLGQAFAPPTRLGSNAWPDFHTAQATRSSLRARMTSACVGSNPRALIDRYSGPSALLWEAANADRYIWRRSCGLPRLETRRLPVLVPESFGRGSRPLYATTASALLNGMRLNSAP